ncbi:MAG TPA: FAD-dependent monooxygenase [Xanthobacteraceae bacterium]|nr:FAD-dependent monooxygenase [Xanthobacteraceae bacterium]
MAKEKLSVAIIGGGIGGLFAAKALLAHGIEVAVYEQAPQLGEIGAGVIVTPNSSRHLARVGLKAAVEKYGAPLGPGSHYWHDNGEAIAPVQVTDSAGIGVYGMHRADFISFLAGALPAGVVRPGKRCTGFSQDGDTARVTFADGTSVQPDVVVGADGIHSELRPHVYPPSKPVFSNQAAYRGLVPHEQAPQWRNDIWQMWLGKGKHFLVFPVRAGTIINFVGFHPAGPDMRESWSAPGDPDALRAEFAGWDPRIGALLAQVKHTFRSALYDREPIPVWTKGRLTLLGDAAHPMLPHLGQGANQSIEDGMALAAILAHSDRRNAPAALLAYEKLRRERVADVQLGARRNGMRYDSMTGDIVQRDAEIVAHANFRKTLYDHDVLPEAEKAAREMV